MGVTRSNHSLTNQNNLSTLTLNLLDEIISVFSLNCISPWSHDATHENNLGLIPSSQFVNVSRQIGLTYTPSESRSINKELKLKGIDFIDVDTFVQLVDNKIRLDSDIKSKVPEFTSVEDFLGPKLDECYTILDWQKSGKLPSSDLKHMLSCFDNGQFDSSKLNTLFKSAGLTSKRIISKDDFRRMFMPISDTSFFSVRLFDETKSS
ncbi:hypothetical protein TpMuguga_04g00532 [Theileria parva strain Muguga]|uniref:EF-hand domain-containing protein n=1 Tax=Theileria parva TaxID=5875 RepID=Q4N241_THEPA|nr:uncharacterized protein TpMuguga_04g00532 [Theileria parva strain Muguga]EAN31884.1 hypothetical protein TpMuguga_04g00532 [Theileria parva strain Muguga]|eukprot:XP_764167.1 hypothetical protein [Theileria parva strain Muguga]